MPRSPQPAAPQNQCALCSQTITTFNDSEEHIIPQAIGGGRLTVQGLPLLRVQQQERKELGRCLSEGSCAMEPPVWH